MKKNHVIIIASLLMALLYNNAYSSWTYTANAGGGNWNQNATWTGVPALGATYPKAGDAAIIPNGITVTVNTNSACASISMTGTGGITFSNNYTLTLTGNFSNSGTGTFTTNGKNCTITIGGTYSNSGTFTLNGTSTLEVAGDFSNSGTFSVNSTSTLEFNGSSNTTVTGSGTFSIAGDVEMNMNAQTTELDVESSAFIDGINTGGKYYFTFTQGTWIMDNAATLDDAYNSGSSNQLTIPYDVIIQVGGSNSTAGTMNCCKNCGAEGDALLEGKLYMDGATATFCNSSHYDFQYHLQAAGDVPELNMSSGTLTLGGGFNAQSLGAYTSEGTDYIDFQMSGGTINVSNNANGSGGADKSSFQINNKAGGTTNMSGGTIIIETGSQGTYPDLDLGNSSLSSYSVTGGTVQFGNASTPVNYGMWIYPNGATYNYPNIVVTEADGGTVYPMATGTLAAMSMTIDASSTFSLEGGNDNSSGNTIDITGNNGTYAWNNNGSFSPDNGTVAFTGSSGTQIIEGSTTAFYNLTINNSSGMTNGVIQDVNTQVSNQLTLTSGAYYLNGYTLELTANTTTISGGSSSAYVVSEDTAALKAASSVNSLLQWDGISTHTGTYTFPFGCTIGASNYYLPFVFHITTAGTSGADNNISVGTWHTSIGLTPFAPTVTAMNGLTTNATGCDPGTNGRDVTINRCWQINPSTHEPTATVTFTYAGVENNIAAACGGGTATLSAQESKGGGSWAAGVGSAAGVTTGTGSVAPTGLSSFSPWVLSVSADPLPVQLLSFTAVCDNNNVLLQWSTATETNNSYFTIECSENGEDFLPVGTVKGAINSESTRYYSFTDENSPMEDAYYRLTQTDLDGNTVTASTIAYQPCGGDMVNAYIYNGNSVKMLISSTTKDEYTLTLSDMTGREVITKNYPVTSGMNTFSLNTNLPEGIYILSLNGNNSTFTKKVLIER